MHTVTTMIIACVIYLYCHDAKLLPYGSTGNN